MSYPLEKAKKEIISLLKKALSQLKYECEIKLEIPPENMGDFAFPCFALAPIAKKPPNNIAEIIAKKLEKGKWVEKIEPHRAYVNFFLNNKKIKTSVLKSVLAAS